MIRYQYILAFFCSLIFSYGIAQQHFLSFKHLTIDDGLSQSSVTCIHQDKTGFIWIGTHDGLNRYDGYEFVHYRNKRSDANSISNNYITDIYEDAEGVLWIATFGGGLNSLNPLNGIINRYNLIPGDSTSFPSSRLFSIAETPPGILWIGGNEGLIRFDKSTGKSKIFLASKIADQTYDYNYIGKVTSDGTGNLWLRSDSGLTKFDTKTCEAKYFQRSPYSNAHELGDVFDMKYTNGNLLIACDAGLVEINTQEEKDTLLLAAGATPSVFMRILPLSNSHYAIGTNNGLLIYHSDTEKTLVCQSNSTDAYSLSHNAILSLFKSSDGILWIGTRNGLNQLEDEKPQFVHVRKIIGKYDMSSNNVNSFLEENDSLLWIGTTDGLNLYNKNLGTVQAFRKNMNKNIELTTDYMLHLFKDSKGNKWLGTRRGGFYKIENDDKGNIKINQVRPSNADASLINIHFITEGNDGILWIGTGGEGLWRYHTESNTVKQYFTAKDGTGPSHPFVFTILKDSHDNIWLGTPGGGLNLFDPKTERFITFQHSAENENSLSNDIILSLHEDQQNQLWIGTNGGLNMLVPKLDENIFQWLGAAIASENDSLFLNFGYEQGFPNDVIYGILETPQRELWLSTNKGLAVFDLNRQQLVHTFDVNDGLQSNEFNQNGYLQGKTGLFYFGGVNGFNMFYPENMNENTFIPPVAITGMSLFNEPVSAGFHSSGQIHLEKEIQYLDEINLSYKHNFITFNFAALSFKSSQKNQYRYKLEGLHDDWVQAGNMRNATFSHLAPGKYIFKVEASNNSGIWSDDAKALIVRISAPPWLSWYAYLIYFFILAVTGYLFVRFRIKRATRELKIQAQIEKARSQEREAFRKKSAADFHDEAGNKITKINLFTEMARREVHNREQLENYLEKIQLNATELSAGMRDFLWVLDPQQDSLFGTISRLKDFGDSNLSDIGVRFTLHGMNADLRKIKLPMNTRREILQIFKEAVNNCAKYAKATEAVLSIRVVDHSIIISMADDGKGFDPSAGLLQNKYGLTIMRERAQKIGAELDIKSQISQGTSITLKCKIPHLGYR